MPKTIPIKKPQQEEINLLKEQYPKGKRIRLLWMDCDEPVRYGTLGTIRGIDSLGQIMVEWDCGSELSLIPEVDEFEIL